MSNLRRHALPEVRPAGFEIFFAGTLYGIDFLLTSYPAAANIPFDQNTASACLGRCFRFGVPGPALYLQGRPGNPAPLLGARRPKRLVAAPPAGSGAEPFRHELK